ncbi:MAG TPA: C45 family peptidase [Candidatus Methylomirabilis sp.]|nr:C45 family peptidase [Candidatus Methylomirabilis sp.]
MTQDIMPFVHVQGTWGEMGAQVGQMFAPLIERHVDAWLDHVQRETGADRTAVLAIAASYAAPIREHAPFLWEELEGMARGSGVAMDRLLLLQARAEVMRVQKERAARPALECTTFAVGTHRTAGERVLYGQNVDLVPFLQEYGVVVRQHPKGAPATLYYTTAGLLGHNGLNEAGVGICANFINDPGGWGDGLPRYLLSRLALRQDSAERALEAALAPPRAASRNLLIADATGVFLDAEVLRKEAAVIRGKDGLLVHANHLEAPEFAGYETAAENSCLRRRRLEQLLEPARTPLDVGDLQGFYRDHANAPHSLCAHPFPGRNVQTVASLIGDLSSLELHLAKGSPCRSVYATYTLATCRQGSLSVEVRDRFREIAGRP